MSTPTMSPVTDGSDLTTAPQRTAIDGVEQASDLKSFGTDLTNILNGNFDGIDTTIDGFAVALDFLGDYVDPLGSLISAGVGWFIEHVSFLREPFDALTGDPQSINAVAETWNRIGEQLAQSGEQYETALTSVEDWDGKAAEDYRSAAEQYVLALDGLAKHCGNVATGVTLGGLVAASGRGVVLTLISRFIEEAVIELLAALATSWCTFGASLAVAATALEVEATLTATSCEIKVTMVATRASEIGVKMAEYGEKAERVAAKLEKLQKRAEEFEKTPLGRIHHQDEMLPGRAIRKTTETIEELHDNSKNGAE